MDDRSLRVLEFYNLLEILREFALSPLGRKRCEALRPSHDLPTIQSRLSEVMEFKEILETSDEIPIHGLKDIEAILEKLEIEGATLQPTEIIDIYSQIALCKGTRRFFNKLDIQHFPRLQEKVSDLTHLKILEREILQVMNTKGEILDRASPTLSDIRHRMGMLRERGKSLLEQLLHREELQSIFQEQFITLRNGRYVVLIKSDFKHRLKGIIHDQSQSGMTFFFEPLQVVPLNNEINILMGEEKEEEYRILADLSTKVREEKQNLWKNLEILGELDLLYAMAKLSIHLKSVQPLLNQSGKVDMREARNPLLIFQKQKEVIPIHLVIRDGIRVLILSGANAGGKTVALKTLGLLTLMVQSGLPVPVGEGSQIAIFQNIFAMIGDEQNIEENLSTFSSHLLHLNQILEKVDSDSLILLDELGVGTHASEGCALAMGFLDRFREIGASIIITTHFDRLKVYGYLHPDVENVAVEFDEESLEPKYTLSYGSSGFSNALLVAEKFGVSERVLKMARHYMDGGDQEVTRALQTFESLKADTEKERLKLMRMEEEVALKRQRLKDLLGEIKRRKDEILSQAEVKAKKKVKELQEELREWIRSQKEEKSFLHLPHSNIHHKKIQEMKDRFFPPIKMKKGHGSPFDLRVGDHVKIMSLQTSGVLMSVEESSKEVEVTTEKANVRTFISDIVKVMEEKEESVVGISKSQPFSQGNGKEFSSQLNVIGLTIEDALPKVDRFIDQALLQGLEKVQIIHGVGSGRLRSAIGKYLHEHQGVKGVSPGDRLRGGGGVTLVELE